MTASSTPILPLDAKWSALDGRFFMTGTQALVKLLLIQAERDRRSGLRTRGFVSGYRGSPLGGLDQTLWKAREHLTSHGIVFEPGLNEELAATMVWGSQQVKLSPGFKDDGVFSMWYGKGPGVDRAMDAIKHANAAGTLPHGGALLVAGDDHAARSSTMPHQSDHMLMAAMIPTLAPSDAQEFIDFGLHGYAMSRYCGCWVGLLAVADTVESGGLVDVSVDRVVCQSPSPDEFPLPADGLGLRWPDDKMKQEARLQELKVYAALAYARKNQLNRIHGAAHGKARLGIVSSGKAWLDTLQALDDLGLPIERCSQLGIRLLKLGLSWPLESEIVQTFAEGLDEILVIEEKRPIIEYLLKEHLYNWEDSKRPRIVGKFDEGGEWAQPQAGWLLRAAGELTPTDAALAIASRLAKWPELARASDAIADRVTFLRAKRDRIAQPVDALIRAPHYCSGCPHSRSTRTPHGSRSFAGIGCHFMATWIDPATQAVSQMGGEGVAWSGACKFTEEPHVFANLGDGTFWHSGSLALRQSIATGANITYKILHNDAVAMTGGQPIEGSPGPLKLLWSIFAEGPSAIAVLSENLDAWRDWRSEGRLPSGVTIHDRDELEAVEARLKATPGASVLFYDQTCASEKRRRRKRGTYPAAARKAWINPAVCEGCGDCSFKSGCLSVEPLETELGRKRRIDQHSCNQDLSCVDGFCPSFVTVDAPARPARPDFSALAARSASLPDPSFAWSDSSLDWNIVFAGVGGQGVVTLSQTLAVAASLAGLDPCSLDQTGLAQKGGAVMSHLRLARRSGVIKAARTPDGECDLLLANDLPTACLPEALGKLSRSRSRMVANARVSISSSFLRDGSVDLKEEPMREALRGECQLSEFIDARDAAQQEFQEEIAAGFILAGRAWQLGWLPIPRDHIHAAIRLNGASVDLNLAAFERGRSLAAFAAGESRISLESLRPSHPSLERQLQLAFEWGGDRARQAHDRFIVQVHSGWDGSLSAPLSKALQKLCFARLRLACLKDEYEVARLHAQGSEQGLLDAFGSKVSGLRFHMAPPLWPGNPAASGRKIAFDGRWMLPALRLLSRFRFLRGTAFDPFSYSQERRADLADLPWLESLSSRALDQARSRPESAASSLGALADAALSIKGFGHVRARARASAQSRAQLAMDRLVS